MAAPPKPAAPAVSGASLPTISGHHDALDGVRAVAAFAVLVLHVASDTGKTFRTGAAAYLFSGGAIGVPVFFTLSGLLLYRPWAAAVLLEGRDGVRTGRYLWRRMLRIYPAYWAVVAYVMLVVLPDHARDVWTWVKLLTLTYTYDPHPWWQNFLGPPGLGQIWSLTVEVAWYAALPVTAAVLAWYARRGGPAKGPVDGAETDRRARRLLHALAAYAAASFVVTLLVFLPSPHPQLGVLLPRFFAWFAIGMALSVVSVWAHAGSPVAIRFARTVAASWGLCWTIAAVFYCIASSPIAGPTNIFTPDTPWTAELRVLLYGLVAAFFVAPVALSPASRPELNAVLGNPVMRFLGRISYGVFLWQLAVSYTWFKLTHHVPFSGSFLLEFPVIAALTIAIATVTFYVIEKPALWLAHRR